MVLTLLLIGVPHSPGMILQKVQNQALSTDLCCSGEAGECCCGVADSCGMCGHERSSATPASSIPDDRLIQRFAKCPGPQDRDAALTGNSPEFSPQSIVLAFALPEEAAVLSSASSPRQTETPSPELPPPRRIPA